MLFYLEKQTCPRCHKLEMELENKGGLQEELQENNEYLIRQNRELKEGNKRLRWEIGTSGCNHLLTRRQQSPYQLRRLPTEDNERPAEYTVSIELETINVGRGKESTTQIFFPL